MSTAAAGPRPRHTAGPATGLDLAVLGGLPSPVRLAAVDAVHLYVGVGAVVILATKTGRAGWKLRVPGEPETAPRRRWLSWSLVALYGAVAVTGGLALVPLPGGAQAAMVDGHLIAAVWATGLGQRRRAPGQGRAGPGRPRRFPGRAGPPARLLAYKTAWYASAPVVADRWYP